MKLIQLIKLKRKLNKISRELLQNDYYTGVEKNKDPKLIIRWKWLHKEKENLLNKIYCL